MVDLGSWFACLVMFEMYVLILMFLWLSRLIKLCLVFFSMICLSFGRFLRCVVLNVFL